MSANCKPATQHESKETTASVNKEEDEFDCGGFKPNCRASRGVPPQEVPWKWGVALGVGCRHCGQMLTEKRYPVSGDCGHSICVECHDTLFFNDCFADDWEVCPLKGCKKEKSFHSRDAPKNFCAMEAIDVMENLVCQVQCVVSTQQIKCNQLVADADKAEKRAWRFMNHYKKQNEKLREELRKYKYPMKEGSDVSSDSD